MGLGLEKEQLFICECHSMDHIMLFSYDEEDNQVFVHIRLSTYHNFFNRLWRGLKYAFGLNSRFGNFDEFLVQPDDALKMIETLNKIKQPPQEETKKLLLD